MDEQIKSLALKDAHPMSSKTPAAILPMHWLLCRKGSWIMYATSAVPLCLLITNVSILFIYFFFYDDL